MKFIKRNKFTIMAIIIFIGLVIVAAQVKDLLVPDEGKAVYGDRLNGIEDHKIADSVFAVIESKLKEDSKVVKVQDTIHGKVINYIITVGDDVSISDAKKIGNSIIGMFENKELDFYSLNVYIEKEDAKLNNFPIEGYKSPSDKELVFTKDREITSEEDKNEE